MPDEARVLVAAAEAYRRSGELGGPECARLTLALGRLRTAHQAANQALPEIYWYRDELMSLSMYSAAWMALTF